MREFVSNHIYNCLNCIAFSAIENKRQAFCTIHLDHYGPLHRTSSGNKYVL